MTRKRTTRKTSVPVSGSAVKVVAASGSAVQPAFSFAGDTDTGMYNDTTDTITFASAGVVDMEDKRPLVLRKGDREIDVWDICQRVLIMEQLMTPEQRTQYQKVVERMRGMEALDDAEL